ncbi:root hair defective 3 GTP-binding protein-domain-containing protein [Thamnocephalis sphaerospora]|uniref:Root hair defective 3 GTP-binding protein-domain-containing protein n=1 Tax=Thamnocephalis sphaerospora TaxID=78915 RepID=A0A4P9XQB4_9FUNG|nr:root hair defective 3 GTP-binding protein-domain-containing protein [Thamnocephalis sphaerospora]|eukprot:RKP07470.1 root hair defective 3 GTP-binding protein-domain-containing protein [Thamnocephalis sphaerospora]
MTILKDAEVQHEHADAMTESIFTDEADDTTVAESTDVGGQANAEVKEVEQEVDPADLEYRQLIDTDQVFSKEASEQAGASLRLKDEDDGYNTVAVFGLHDSGKSTLLNELYGTEFPAGNECGEPNATEGILVSKAPGNSALIFDAGGSDGREDGDSQVFEKRKATFMIAVASVLIINISENMIKTRNRDIIQLLEMVFKTHLQFFAKQQMTHLLFVIRDHYPSAPKEPLQKKLSTDMETPEGLENCTISNFFDCSFAFMSHIQYAKDDFGREVTQLRSRFTNKNSEDYIFLPSYWKLVPAGSLPSHLESIWSIAAGEVKWEQPEEHFESLHNMTSAYAFDRFLRGIKPVQDVLSTGAAEENFAPAIKKQCDMATTVFDGVVKKYECDIYEAKRKELVTRCHDTLRELFRKQLTNITKKTVRRFSNRVRKYLEVYSSNEEKLRELMAAARKTITARFEKDARASILEGSGWTLEDKREQLERDMMEIVTQLRIERALQQQEIVTQQRIKEAVEQQKRELEAIINQQREEMDRVRGRDYSANTESPPGLQVESFATQDQIKEILSQLREMRGSLDAVSVSSFVRDLEVSAAPTDEEA